MLWTILPWALLMSSNTPSNLANSKGCILGISAQVDGDFCIVGSPLDCLAVQLFTLGSNCNWSKKLQLESNAIGVQSQKWNGRLWALASTCPPVHYMPTSSITWALYTSNQLNHLCTCTIWLYNIHILCLCVTVSLCPCVFVSLCLCFKSNTMYTFSALYTN